MYLGDYEWRDALLLCYGIYLTDLPKICDGYGSKLFITHALNWKKGGLVTTWQEYLCGGVANLDSKKFKPLNMK